MNLLDHSLSFAMYEFLSFFCIYIVPIPQTKLPQLISPPLDSLILSNQAKNKIQLFHSEQLIQSKNNLAAVKSLLKSFNHFVNIF